MKSHDYYVLAVALILSFSSCKKEVKADLPYEEEKVVNLLADFHFAKSASAIHKIEIRDSMRTVYESQVLTINKMSREEYDKLIKLLESDLKLYYEIEKKVHSHLKTIQNEKK